MILSPRKRVLVVATGFIVVTAACAALVPYGRLALWLDVGEQARPVDFVISLPGDENHRPFVAAALVNAGFAKQGLIIQNPPSPEVEDGFSLPTSETIRRVYEYSRVPADKVRILDGESLTTAGDIDVLAHFLVEHPTATVAVVTSNYHTRRARWTLHTRLGEAAERIMMISAPQDGFEMDRWWETEDGFVLVSTEYVKLVAYWVLYGSAKWWAAGVALAVGAWVAGRRWRVAGNTGWRVAGSG